MKNRILGAVVLAFGLLLPNDALPQLENPPGPLPGPSDPEVRLPGGKLQKEEILKADHEKSVKDAAQLIDLAESPEVQAEGIVKQFNWYPGIDPQHVQSKMDQASWNKLFTDISPSDLSRYGRPFPLSEYFTDIVEGYERVVIK